jgi:hypothetical protein
LLQTTLATSEGGVDDERRVASRRRRWGIFRRLRVVTSLRGGTRICQTPAGANVALGLIDGIARVSGIRRCGSPWACPLCAPTVREGRAREIDCGVAAHLANGGGAVMATCTMPHDYGDKLSRSLSTVKASWRRVCSGKAWLTLKGRLGIVGQIKALEITHGPNGWHPHVHVLVLTERPLEVASQQELRRFIFDRWSARCVALGFRAPSWERGCDVRPVTSAGDLSRYLTKVKDGWGVGLELARSDLKQGRGAGYRSPWQIIADATETGDVADLALWHEYEQATFGSKAITWSPKLRALLLGSDDEVTDDELAAADDLTDDESPLVLIPSALWAGLVAVGACPDLYRALETGGAGGAGRFLDEFVSQYRQSG